jgi:hypothetical protein
MTDTIKLLNDLKYFTGSEEYYRNPLFKKFIYTEGVKYLAENAQAYWLIDYIFSYQTLKLLQTHPFQVWKIKVAENNTAIITVEDGNKQVLKTFKLDYTDFPLEEFSLWFIEGTLLLPSEY